MRSYRSGADGVVGIDEVFQSAFLEELPFWTTINASPYRARASRPAAPLKKVSGLTPITMYGFQIQALGVLGYSDWSTTETIVVN